MCFDVCRLQLLGRRGHQVLIPRARRSLCLNICIFEYLNAFDIPDKSLGFYANELLLNCCCLSRQRNLTAWRDRNSHFAVESLCLATNCKNLKLNREIGAANLVLIATLHHNVPLLGRRWHIPRIGPESSGIKALKNRGVY